MEEAVKAAVLKENLSREYWFEEGCFILEAANDKGDEFLSIARARVLPGTRTSAHMLDGIAERYIIVNGRGRVEIGNDIMEEVTPGDVVRIPENTRQSIANIGEDDLIFYVVCSPPFTHENYVHLETATKRKSDKEQGE